MAQCPGCLPEEQQAGPGLRVAAGLWLVQTTDQSWPLGTLANLTQGAKRLSGPAGTRRFPVMDILLCFVAGGNLCTACTYKAHFFKVYFIVHLFI